MSDRILSRRPLTASARDQALYVEPPELDVVLASIAIGTNVFVSGPPGSGKTTLARRLEAGDPAVTVVQAEWETTIDGLISAIAKAVSGESDILEDRAPGTERAIREIHEAVERRSPTDPPLNVVVVDGASDEQLSVLFGRYRDALWELPLSWVVTSRSKVPEPPADAFFDRVVELTPWTVERLVHLAKLRAPDAWDHRLHDVVRVIAPATPLRGLLTLQAFLVSSDSDSLVAELQHEQDVVGGLPDRLRALYRALVALGPVSASDDELLRTLGVSRSRVTHGLKELEGEQLVVAERDGKKVLYRAQRALADAASFGTLR